MKWYKRICRYTFGRDSNEYQWLFIMQFTVFYPFTWSTVILLFSSSIALWEIFHETRQLVERRVQLINDINCKCGEDFSPVGDLRSLGIGKIHHPKKGSIRWRLKNRPYPICGDPCATLLFMTCCYWVLTLFPSLGDDGGKIERVFGVFRFSHDAAATARRARWKRLSFCN